MHAASISFGTPFHVGENGLAALRQVGSAPAAEDGVIKSWPVDRPQLLEDMVTIFNYSSELVTAPFVTLARFLIRCRPTWRRALHNGREHMRRRIDAARATAEASGGWPDKPDNVLVRWPLRWRCADHQDLMLSKADVDSEERLDDHALQDEAMLFLVAVSDHRVLIL